MMKNRTGLVALIVLAAATLLMVFFVLPNLNKDKPAQTPVSTLTDVPAGTGGETTTAGGKQARSTGEAATDTEASATQEKPADNAAGAESATAETAKAETKTETAEAAPADPTAGWVTPAFDVLRVEPDGSTVIAGRGQPNTKLEIRNGDTVVATADVGPSGDFAAVFDQPLSAGDYQLTLNTKDDKGASKTSEEVATISVPKDGSGELLAMVSKPGEASRLITVPDAGTKTAVAETAQAAKSVTDEAAEAVKSVAGDVAEATDEAAKATGDALAEATDTKAGADTAGTGTAAATPEAAATAGDAAAPASDAKAQIRVSAVELEGDHMFVAGTTKPGALVRIYADDKLVGEAKADEAGRYVVDGGIDLSVGRHAVRADVMNADGSKVDFRASVPFDRPEGEQVAVVAQDEAATPDAGPALGLIGGGTFDKLRGEADKALALLKGLYADGRLPTAEELAAARSATEIALKSLAEFRPGEEEGDAARRMAAKASAAAADALARLQALPADAASVGAALGTIETAVADALAPAIEKAHVAAGDVAAAADDTIEALTDRATALRQQFAGLFADGRNATSGEIQTARVALEGVLKRIVGFTPPAGTASDVAAAIEGLKGWASTALDRLSAVPAGAGHEAYQQALAALEGMPSLTAAAEAVATATQDAAAPAAGESGSAKTESGVVTTGSESAAATGEAKSEAADEPQTVEQAPLKESKTSVIIRRGDTLWQISRRIYGKGVRYTTIYLANEDQISDPDRIIPGQVFGIPDKTMESDAEAEEMHRKHVHGD